MIDFAKPSLTSPLITASLACSRKRSPRVNPSVPTRPTKRNSRREGRQAWSELLHQEHPKESRIIVPLLPETTSHYTIPQLLTPQINHYLTLFAIVTL